jgi:hypothetical protein
MLVHPDFSFVDGGMDLQTAESYATCRLSFGLATTLPRLAYASEAFQRLENEKIWSRAWVCVGTEHDIARVGDLLPYTIGQHAIHVQRRENGDLIGRFNKAQHGGCRSVPVQCRTGRKTKCSYTSCGHSRDRGVIPGDDLGEMSPLVGQYLGSVPEKLLRAYVRVEGGCIFVNVDPGLDENDPPPAIFPAILAARRGGVWREHRCNWKLAGANLVDVARTDARGGALNYVEAEWHFPNLVLIRAHGVVASVVLQPTAMDQTLWRTSFFSDLDGSKCDVARAALEKLLDRAAERATVSQVDFELVSTGDITETTRAGWRFNQTLIDRITRRHKSYWNGPLVDATVMA